MLTCNFEGSILANDADFCLWVGGVTVVDPDVWLAVLVVDDPQEEELTGGKQHPMGLWVLVGGGHLPAVSVPGDGGRRVSFRLAVEGRGLVLSNVLVFGMFDYARVGDLLDTWSTEENCVIEVFIEGTIDYFTTLTHKYKLIFQLISY